jgi:hypothetical protein
MLISTESAPFSRDRKRFEVWRHKAVAYMSNLPQNDWECLALAQHHGLATKLLDWSFNPLVATFFAVSEEPCCDGVVYCYFPTRFISTSVSLSGYGGAGWGFIPLASTPRILNQRSVFTQHDPPDAEINPRLLKEPNDMPDLTKLVIDSRLKQVITNHLDIYGINRVTLFPDLDGLSEYINSETREMVE